MIKQLWTEKYRSTTIEDYVFTNESQRAQVATWIREASIPHLMFSGPPGTGKTTLARLLIRELKVEPYDVLEINASRENDVDTVREKIIGHVSTMPFGAFKVVFLDEVDYFSLGAQAILRGVMETYVNSSRFVMTCNSPHKLMPALHSRCQGFHIDKLDHTEFTSRAATVLLAEDIEFELDTLDTYVKTTYPDLRKCLNLLQMNSSNGKLTKPTASNASTADYRLTAVELFKQGELRRARETICAQIRPEEIDEFFTWCYTNLELWGSDSNAQDEAVMIIRRAMVNHPLCADPEINLAAMFIELARINEE